MPFVRVSYLENKYDTQQLPVISDVIMCALIEYFTVPEDDFFQVFHAHKAGEFYYSKNYLNIRRTDGLLYIQITLKSGRSTEQKQSFYRELAGRLSNTLTIRKEDVFVVLVDTEFEDWTFGNGVAQMIERPGKEREALE
ncbi:MAG TPA: tautomerase family protein [Paenibacillus sp.]|jgi:phenylpyruvate tautomerase PptA (4-oxalocrotonate tautomerase family)